MLLLCFLFYFLILFFSCLINVLLIFPLFFTFCFNVISVGLQVLQSISQAVWRRKGFKMSSYSPPHHKHRYLQMLFTAYCKGPIRWLVLHFLCVLLHMCIICMPLYNDFQELYCMFFSKSVLL